MISEPGFRSFNERRIIRRACVTYRILGRSELRERAHGENEDLVSCQKFRLAKERPCTMKDAELAVSFGGHVGNMVCPRKIMADGEAQKFE